MQQNQILANVIMFLPVGVLTGLLWRWRGLWVAAGLSVFIEVLQLITARGLCEFDDVIHNMVGAVIGVGIVICLKNTEIQRNCKQIEHTVDEINHGFTESIDTLINKYRN